MDDKFNNFFVLIHIADVYIKNLKLMKNYNSLMQEISFIVIHTYCFYQTTSILIFLLSFSSRFSITLFLFSHFYLPASFHLDEFATFLPSLVHSARSVDVLPQFLKFIMNFSFLVHFSSFTNINTFLSIIMFIRRTLISEF